MKLSVALCTYNGENFLSQQLDSIIQQSLPVHEIIICDDGSTDATISIIVSYMRQFASIRMHKNAAQLGAIKNFEKCISLCTGDIIFLSDQDDVWLPDKTQIIADAFANDYKLMLLFTDAMLIDSCNNSIQGSLWEKWKFSPPLQKEWKDNKKAFAYLIEGDNKVTGATAAIRKELKQCMTPFRLPQYFYHDTWLALLAAGVNGLAFISRPLTQYRIHKEQQVGFGEGLAYKAENNMTYISTEDFKQYVYLLFPEHKPGVGTKIQQGLQQVTARIKRRLGLL